MVQKFKLFKKLFMSKSCSYVHNDEIFVVRSEGVKTRNTHTHTRSLALTNLRERDLVQTAPNTHTHTVQTTLRLYYFIHSPVHRRYAQGTRSHISRTPQLLSTYIGSIQNCEVQWRPQ